MKETTNGMTEATTLRMPEGSVAAVIESVGHVASSLGIVSAFWMTYQDHRTVFGRWRQQDGLDSVPPEDCVDLYCAGLVIDQFSLGNVRDFLMEELGIR